MILIKNGLVYTMESAPEKQDVLIVQGKIEAVGSGLEAPEGCTTIDASGKLVFPGFIDAHCHLGMWEDAIGFEGADGNEKSDPLTPHLRAIDGINPMDRTFEEARNGGVTCCATGPGSANVLGGQFSAIKTVGDRIDDMIVQENLAMKCAFGENPKRVYNEKKTSPMTRMAIAAELRTALAKAKIYADKLEMSKEDVSKRPELDMKMEALVPVINREIPLKAHAHRADDIFTAIRIAKEFDVKITLEHCTEGHLIADHIAGEGLPAIVGPSFGERSKFELKNLTFETPGVLAGAGVKVAIMTDHPVVPLHYLPMCAALSVKAGMDEEEALKAITINPAEILEIDARVGSIKVGKDADVVLWDKHPFELDARVEKTIIDGKIVFDAMLDK